MRYSQPDPQTYVFSWQLLNAPLQTRAILGTNDIKEANNVLKWTTNTKNLPIIWLLTLPKQICKRVVVFGVYNKGYADINCNGYVDGNEPARGVVIEPKKFLRVY